MQLSIPNRSLLPRAGPYIRAIVGYGIHWNHPAECTTQARGSCRPTPGICLRSSSFRAFAESGIASGASPFSGTGGEHCFVWIAERLLFSSRNSNIFPRVDVGFNPFEESANPNQRNLTHAFLVKRISRL